MFLALVFLIAFVAFAISAVSGGGAGLLLLPILGTGLAVAQVPVALTTGTAISSVARLGMFRRHVDWRIVRWFVPLSLPGAFLGVALLRYISPMYLEALLGLFLLGNLPALFKRHEPVVATPVHARSVALLGLAAGFVSGLTGAVGLLFNRFYLGYGLGKERVVATRAANEVLLHATKLVLYGAFGLFTIEALTAGVAIGVAAIVAAMVVRFVLPHLSEVLFRRVGHVAMVVAGAVMTFNATSALADEHQVSVATASKKGGVDISVNGFGRWVGIELRRNELPELEYRIGFDELPDERKLLAAPLVAGADRVTVEAVRSWGHRAYELHVHRDGVMSKHTI